MCGAHTQDVVGILPNHTNGFKYVFSYERKTKKYISVDVCIKSVGPALWGINNQSLGENTMAAAKKAAKKPAKKAAKKPAKKKAAAKKK